MTPDPAARLARRASALYTKAEVARFTASDPEGLPPLESYANDQCKFVRDVLGCKPTPDQERIAAALPGRVKLESGHNVGKSFWMACTLIWWFYTRPISVVVCNAPKLEHLRDVLFAEVRMLIGGARRPLVDYFVGPKAPEMYDHPDHWAKGYTTSKGESYQGRHRENMLFLFDEDEGIDPVYWTATGTMYQPDRGHAWLASCNPVTTATQSYLESMLTAPDGNPKWRLFTISALDHPNVKAELAHEPVPIPNAVSIGQVNQWVKDWTTAVNADEDRQAGDVEWPPGSGLWHRPGPNFKSRVLGLRPTEGVDTVWSAAAFDLACRPKCDPRDCWRWHYGVTVGVDPAAYGDDDTALHVRTGPLSLHHEAHNGWGPDRTAARVVDLCKHWSAWYNSMAENDRPRLRPEDVVVNIEFDGGYGVGVYSHRKHFTKWRGVTAGSKSEKLDPVTHRPMFANFRSEMWFAAADRAKGGGMDLSRLAPDTLAKLRLQLLAPYYEVRPDSSRIVEPKKDVKERIGRSPDDADGLIVCHADVPNFVPTVVWGKQNG